jgi:type II restriction/modification system DNA methylase subunit YeeA
MNRTKLRNYAPQARRDFIQAVTDRAAHFGLTAKKVEPITEKGDVVVIAGRAHPRKVAEKRKALEERVRRDGFERTMESLAYTWFNRLVAIRFLELHDYLENGEGGASYRVLSHPEGKPAPEILEKAEHVERLGLDPQNVIDLKLEGTKEAELYRLLLVAQCNALHSAMPFLFEQLDDETELVLTDNLLHSDSLIRKLVGEIDEEDWREVEIIGWLYQFYISEKKDEVIGKVVASEDIPAATQLFTPKWIVKYLVQNTLGRQWLATYPHSALRQQMPYYIEPAEQTPEVQEQLKAITPTNLNPEEITLLDPACGSGHILAEAYDLFKAIYQERGYRAKDIPSLILRKNLFGLEIDDRAAQLAAFALLMKARADDRRIFANGVQPNVLALQESKGLNARDITAALNTPILKEKLPPSEYLLPEVEEAENPLFNRKTLAIEGQIAQADVATLLELFEDAKTFGSLIQIPSNLAAKLPAIEQRLRDVLRHGDLMHALAAALLPLLQQAHLLAQRYDAVVANPPYMGGKYFTGRLKDFVADNYKDAKADLYACFIQRNLAFAKPNGLVGMITIPNWMFLSSFEEVRRSLFEHQTIDSFIHNGRGVFGSDFGTCSFVMRDHNLPLYRGVFRRLFDKQGSVASNEELEQRYHTTKDYTPSNGDFAKIPGTPVAYWVSDAMRAVFVRGQPLGDICPAMTGMRTGDNERFLRYWYEIAFTSIGIGFDKAKASTSNRKWFPYSKGGEYRRWYGNHDLIVNWENDGQEIKELTRTNYPELGDNLSWKLTNEHRYFQTGITWGGLTISQVTFRWSDVGALFDSNKGAMLFPPLSSGYLILGFLNSCVVAQLLTILNPSLSTQNRDIDNLPFIPEIEPETASAISEAIKECIALSLSDWKSWELSWSFERSPLCDRSCNSISSSFEEWRQLCTSNGQRIQLVEQAINEQFIKAYGLQDELSREVPDDQITLYRPDREEDIKRLLSYAIGCMMGRYSMDKPGLIYARSCNVGFTPGLYKTFPADDDGIIPLLETDWGTRDDAANRIVEFVGVAWPKERLEENLKFIADNLGPAKNERPRDTIRRYLATGFYKDHLRWYKRRPIYWLFSSGKERAFQCLVYLHRYHEGTLARMRTEYVIPLQGKIAARIEQLEGDKAKATSTSHRRKIQKEQDALKKQQAELLAFDEKLKHYADQRITLDLDDGVKVNYGKFGDLLAEVKAVCGTKDED